MEATLQPLPFDARSLDGVSVRNIESHHRNNYGGAVRRLAAIRAQFAALDVAASPGFVLNGLKREELVAANSQRLHEVFFASLGGNGVLPEGPLATTLAASFGSVERWRAEFVALGRALAGGSGWVLLSWLPREARLANQWAADHAHALAEAVPLVALDMYEHAYHMDFGADAGAWVDAFMRNLAWDRIAERFELAVATSTRDIEVDAHDVAGDARWTLVDVRRAPIARAATARMRGARWFDPEHVGAWGDGIAAGALRDASVAGAKEPGAAGSGNAGSGTSGPVAVYCVHGHAISRMVAARLRLAGVDAYCVRGGIEHWAAEKLPLESVAGGAG